MKWRYISEPGSEEAEIQGIFNPEDCVHYF